MPDTKPLYTAHAFATGDGRQGHVASSDQTVDTDLALPKEMRGAGGLPNPEIFFAAGLAACFHNALSLVAGKAGTDLGDSSVSSEVTLGANAAGGFELAVSLTVAAPGTDQETLERLVATTEQVCPYSNAVRGNVPLEINVKA